MDTPFLARITSSDHFGTGILVASDCLLTCAHDVDRDDISLYFPGVAGWPAFTCRATVVDASDEDLALLVLDRPCPREPLRIYRLAADLLQSPDHDAHRIAGFAGPEDGMPTTVTFQGVLLSAETDGLIEFQTAGGLPPGMSGSPLLAVLGQTQVCLGMACRGGRGVSHSRFIGPAPMLAFLRRHGIDGECRAAASQAESRRQAMSADPISFLRGLQSASASCRIIPVRAVRGFVAGAEARPVFRPHTHVRVHVYLPHPCEVTFIGVEHLDQVDARYEVLGLDLLPGELPAAGYHRLPPAAPLIMTGEEDTCSLVMLAWASGSGWHGVRPAARTRVARAPDLHEPLRLFERLPAAERHVSIFEYDIR